MNPALKPLRATGPTTKAVAIALLSCSGHGCHDSNAVVNGGSITGATGGSQAKVDASKTAGGIGRATTLPQIAAGAAASPMVTAPGGGMTSAIPASASVGGAATVKPPAAGVASAAAGMSGSSVADAQAGTAAPSGATSCHPAEYMRASLLSIQLSWDDSLGIVGGTGPVHLWSRIRVGVNGDPEATETLHCGSLLPIMMTTAVAGGAKVLAEVPPAAFDRPSMPKFTGSAKNNGAMLTVSPGTFLLGIQLADPQGVWPSIDEVPQIMAVDSDGDGKPGITALPRDGDGFTLSPTSVLQTSYADELYSAQRLAFQVTASDDGCPDMITGTADIIFYDTRVIGCHIKGGSDCVAADVTFINQARPPQVAAATGVWVSKLLPLTATCADVRAALPPPQP